jgi:subtilase family serine protease
MNYILNISTYKPFAISISWGAPEVYYPTSLLNSINTLFNSAILKGINITAASGDNGSNNGVGGTGSYADFPASSPNVTSCGGTKLTCPNLVYDNQTVEVAWPSGGGALSGYFNSPTYQSTLNVARRSVPDIALNADPSTGVLYIVNNSSYIFGGTSIVSPIIAAYLTAIGANKFLNPILYTSPSNVFNDVLIGSNGAFTAKTGYDNCSGLGSIIGNLLSSIINNVPTPPSPSPPSPSPPQPTVVNVTSISLNKTNLTIRRGQTYKLTATVLPTNANNKSVNWSVSNTRFATVSSSGLIRAISIGNTTITARTVDQNKTATFRLTIIR